MYSTRRTNIKKVLRTTLRQFAETNENFNLNLILQVK